MPASATWRMLTMPDYEDLSRLYGLSVRYREIRTMPGASRSRRVGWFEALLEGMRGGMRVGEFPFSLPAKENLRRLNARESLNPDKIADKQTPGC